MPPPEEDENGVLPQSAFELKLEAEELPELDRHIDNDDESFENEGEQYQSVENVICSYKSENITMDQYVTEENFEDQTGKNVDLMTNIMNEGNSAVTFENIDNSGFEEGEPMEAEVSEQSSHQETFFQLPSEKRELNENSMLSDANMITESDDGFEAYESDMLQQTEDDRVDPKNNETESEIEKNFYYKQQEEEEDEEEETIAQGEEYFQEEQSGPSENFSGEPVFIESSGFQNMEEYGSSEQVIETTESEIPAEYINETAESVQSIVNEKTEEPKLQSLKGKTIMTKDNIFQINQSNLTMRKLAGGENVRAVQSPLKRPLLPGPGQSKNVFTKVIIQGNTATSGSGQPLKIIQSGGSPLISGQTRTISLAQAQQMGLISPGAKIQQILPSGSAQKKMIYKKIVPTCSSSLLSPSTSAKSPTKILPAPSPSKVTNVRPSVTAIRGPVSVANIQTIRGNVPVGTIKTISNDNRSVPMAALTALRQSGLSNVNLKPVGTVKSLPGAQKVIIRQGQLPLKSGAILSPGNAGQIIRIPANTSTFQPIQIGGGKQVQYVRLVSGSGATLPTTVINNSKSKIVKTPISQASYKAIPIAPNPNSTVKTVLPKPSVSVSNAGATPKRILIPVSQAVSQLCIANDGTTGEESDGEKSRTITTVPVSSLQQFKNTGSITAISPSAVAQLRQGRNIATITNSQLTQLKSGQSSIQIKAGESGLIPVTAVTQGNTEKSFVVSEGSIVMLTPEIVQQIQNTAEPPAGETVPETTEAQSKSSENEVQDEENFDKENIDSDGCRSSSPGRMVEANGLRMKKPCNCTRSQCLKLYCECFANGEFCFQCNCNNCFNNIEHEEERQKSIKSCLERNPSAFRPKIQIGETEEDERRHNKGCHCKRSGCLKNYCECYEAKITCSKSCKCIGCRNTEEFLEGSRSGLIDLADAAEESFNEQKSEYILRPQSTNSSVKQPYNFMSSEVVEATCQCLLAQAEEAERNGLSTEEGERLIIEEFGRCLVQIIGCSSLEENNSSR